MGHQTFELDSRVAFQEISWQNNLIKALYSSHKLQIAEVSHIWQHEASVASTSIFS